MLHHVPHVADRHGLIVVHFPQRFLVVQLQEDGGHDQQAVQHMLVQMPIKASGLVLVPHAGWRAGAVLEHGVVFRVVVDLDVGALAGPGAAELGAAELGAAELGAAELEAAAREVVVAGAGRSGRSGRIVGLRPRRSGQS